MCDCIIVVVNVSLLNCGSFLQVCRQVTQPWASCKTFMRHVSSPAAEFPPLQTYSAEEAMMREMGEDEYKQNTDEKH